MTRRDPEVFDLWGNIAEAVDDLGRQRRDEDFLAYGHRVVERLKPLVDRAIRAAVAEERERREFKSRDDPEANGRTPAAGEQRWTFTFPLNDGTTLTLHVGRIGRDALIQMAHEERTDDVIAAAAIRAES